MILASLSFGYYAIRTRQPLPGSPLTRLLRHSKDSPAQQLENFANVCARRYTERALPGQRCSAPFVQHGQNLPIFGKSLSGFICGCRAETRCQCGFAQVSAIPNIGSDKEGDSRRLVGF